MKIAFSTTTKAMLGLSIAFVFYACKGNDAVTPALPDTVSFQQHIQPIFDTHCSIPACHTGSSPSAHLNLTAGSAYSQLFAKHEIDTLTPPLSVLYLEMNASSNYMPPTGKLDDYYRQLVLKWIQQKAKNN